MDNERLNRAYRERNIAVIALAKMAILAGYNAGKGKDQNDIEEKWNNVVYIDLPNGKQISFHIAPDEVGFLKDIPEYNGEWDGTFLGRDGEYLEDWGVEAINISLSKKAID